MNSRLTVSESVPRPTYQEESVLRLLEAHVQSQRLAMDILERKAQHNFTVINIIAGFVAAFNLDFANPGSSSQFLAEHFPLVVVFALYAIVAVRSVRALTIRTQATVPMKPTLLGAEQWSTSDIGEHIEALRESYIDVYQHNKPVVEKKGHHVQWSHRLIGAMIVLLVLDASGIWLALQSRIAMYLPDFLK